MAIDAVLSSGADESATTVGNSDTKLVRCVRGNAGRIINWASEAATRAGAMGNRSEQETCLGIANELSMLTGVPNTWAATSGGPGG